MSTPSVPAAAGTTLPVAPDEPRKLDDVMLAMDVVDTLRHRTRVVDMELNEDAREEQLVARLKEIYGAQGIEVPDRILKDGVKALQEQRFVYKPPADSLSVKLAKLYVSRSKWLPLTLGALGVLVAAVVAVQLFVLGPMDAEWRGMPAAISRELAEGQQLAVNPAVDAQLANIAAEGQRDVAKGARDAAKSQLNLLKDMNERLAEEYDVRIVSRPDEDTGFWRQSNDNPLGKNYYIVMEAVAPGGRVLSVPVSSVETQKFERVNIWGQRVNKNTFDRISAEKQANGMVVNDIFGHKARGELDPVFDEPVPGGVITKW